MNHAKLALDYYKRGFLCSQAILAAFCDVTGLPEEESLKLGQFFGSGMRQGEVCGAATGCLMVLGLKFGRSDENDLEKKLNADRICEKFMERFKDANGSYLCRDLLGYDIRDKEAAAKARSEGLFKTLCPVFIEKGAQILDEILNEES